MAKRFVQIGDEELRRLLDDYRLLKPFLYLKLIARNNRTAQISVQVLADAMKVNYRQMRYILDEFQRMGMLTRKGSKSGTVITLNDLDFVKDFGNDCVNDFVKENTTQNIDNSDTYENNDANSCQTNCQTLRQRTRQHYNNNNNNINKRNNTTNVVFKESAREEKPKKVWVKPTIQEIAEYIYLKGYTFNAEAFYYHYESNGWMVGRTHMKDWRAACQTWQHREKTSSTNKNNQYGSKQNTTADEQIARRAAEAYDIVRELTGADGVELGEIKDRFGEIRSEEDRFGTSQEGEIRGLPY